MRKIKMFLVIGLLVSSLFAGEWDIEEIKYDDTYWIYRVADAPEDYKNVIDNCVYSWSTEKNYQNGFTIQLKDRMLKYLNDGKFEIRLENGYECVFLNVDFLYLDVSKEELDALWKILKKNYAGFSDMRKKGFSKKELSEVNNTNELKKILDKYVEDCHFNLNLRTMSYRQKSAYDEGTSPSKDPADIYFEKETKNAYYVRFNNCTSDEYMNNFENIYLKALDKDFIIIDARTNYGGSNWPQLKLRNSLSKNKYKGTVYVLQDNWSFSSGEVWEEFGGEYSKFNCKLVGTHSGGMQNYGNCRVIEDKENNISLFCGKTSFRKHLPSNYLGEGKGYEPDIWATTETMASVLTGLGVDVTGIEFK